MNSVPCERIFSKMGLVVTNLRGNLKPSKVAMVTFVASNAQHKANEEDISKTASTKTNEGPRKTLQLNDGNGTLTSNANVQVPVLSIPENTSEPSFSSLPQMQRGFILTRARGFNISGRAREGSHSRQRKRGSGANAKNDGETGSKK